MSALRNKRHKDVLSQGAYGNCIRMLYEDKDKFSKDLFLTSRNTVLRVGWVWDKYE